MASRTPQASVATPEAEPGMARKPAPMPEPDGGWPPDEFTGKDGRFVRDPFTGVRSPAPETE